MGVSSVESSRPAAPPVTADSPELRLLLACSRRYLDDQSRTRIQSILSSFPFSWDQLLSVTSAHGMLPLTCSHLLNEFSDFLPEDAAVMLRTAFHERARESLLLNAELGNVLQVLKSAGIQALPYKGATLAEWLYGNVALRQYLDIDLLVLSRELAVARKALEDTGYTALLRLPPAQDAAYLEQASELQFISPGTATLVELQWRIVPHYFSIALNNEEFFARSVMRQVGSWEMQTPSPEDTALILAIHGAKHAWARIIWICDYAELLRCGQVNWPVVLGEARRRGVHRLVKIAVLLASRLLDAPLPPEIRPEPEDASDLLRSLEANALAEFPKMGVRAEEDLSYFRLQARLRESWFDKGRVLYRLCTTPSVSEWSMLTLPRGFSGLYRLLRLLRLAGKLVR